MRLSRPSSGDLADNRSHRVASRASSLDQANDAIGGRRRSRVALGNQREAKDNPQRSEPSVSRPRSALHPVDGSAGQGVGTSNALRGDGVTRKSSSSRGFRIFRGGKQVGVDGDELPL